MPSNKRRHIAPRTVVDELTGMDIFLFHCLGPRDPFSGPYEYELSLLKPVLQKQWFDFIDELSHEVGGQSQLRKDLLEALKWHNVIPQKLLDLFTKVQTLPYIFHKHLATLRAIVDVFPEALLTNDLIYSPALSTSSEDSDEYDDESETLESFLSNHVALNNYLMATKGLMVSTENTSQPVEAQPWPFEMLEPKPWPSTPEDLSDLILNLLTSTEPQALALATKEDERLSPVDQAGYFNPNVPATILMNPSRMRRQAGCTELPLLNSPRFSEDTPSTTQKSQISEAPPLDDERTQLKPSML